MEVEVYNIKGAKTDRKVVLSDEIFGIEPNDHAIYLDVKQFMANKRQGTHSSKEKSTLSGSTRKLKKQKGTGGARAGSIKSPLFRGGARVFGPQPRDYNFKLNKKLKRLARLSALAYKAKDNNLTVLEDFSFEAPKTKNFVELLKNFQLTGEKTLLVMSDAETNIFLSSRNLKKVKIIRAIDLNTYEILDAKRLLITESSLKDIETIHQQN
jgi:large subunit ribosomal protein L4